MIACNDDCHQGTGSGIGDNERHSAAYLAVRFWLASAETAHALLQPLVGHRHRDCP